MKDVRVEVRIKNNRLWQACQDAGGARELAGRARVSYGYVLNYLSCVVSPKRLADQALVWKESAIKLSRHLGLNEEELFPEGLYPPIRTKRPRLLAFAADMSQILQLRDVLATPALPEHDPEAVFLKQEMHDVISSRLAQLPARQQFILAARFGLDGNGERTLADVGKMLRVSRERVRNIESRALRSLREHPRALKQFDAEAG